MVAVEAATEVVASSQIESRGVRRRSGVTNGELQRWRLDEVEGGGGGAAGGVARRPAVVSPLRSRVARKQCAGAAGVQANEKAGASEEGDRSLPRIGRLIGSVFLQLSIYSEESIVSSGLPA